jgi:hypothetical protein
VSKEPQLSAGESLVVLRENASRLRAITHGVPHKRLHTPPEADEWAPNEILAHMRACCDVWGGNIAKILAEDHATFPGMNPRTWITRTDYPEWPFEKALRAFSAQRSQLLAVLDALTPDDWERTATVRAYGLYNERTLRSYASKLARHELPHVEQIERAVGPKARASATSSGSRSASRRAEARAG